MLGSPFTPKTIFIWLFIGTLTALYAKRSGKNPYLWFFLGLLLGITGIFILFFRPKVLPKKAPIKSTIATASRGEKLFWYYLDRENRQRGPFEFDILKRAWQRGTLSSDTYVWNETLDKWEFFKDLYKSE